MFPPVACLPPWDLSFVTDGSSERWGWRRSHCLCRSSENPLWQISGNRHVTSRDLRAFPPSGWDEVCSVKVRVGGSQPFYKAFPFELTTACWVSDWTPQVRLHTDPGEFRTVLTGKEDPYDTTEWSPGSPPKTGWEQALSFMFWLRAAKQIGYTQEGSQPLDLSSPHLLFYMAINGQPAHNLLPKSWKDKKTTNAAPDFQNQYRSEETEYDFFTEGIPISPDSDGCFTLSWHVNPSLATMDAFKTRFSNGDTFLPSLVVPGIERPRTMQGVAMQSPWRVFDPSSPSLYTYVRGASFGGNSESDEMVALTYPTVTTCKLKAVPNVNWVEKVVSVGGIPTTTFINFSLKDNAPNDWIMVPQYQKTKTTYKNNFDWTTFFTLTQIPPQTNALQPLPELYDTMEYGSRGVHLQLGRPNGVAASKWDTGFGSAQWLHRPDGAWMGVRAVTSIAESAVSINGQQLISRLAPEGRGGNLTPNITLPEEDYVKDQFPFIWNADGDSPPHPHPCKPLEPVEYRGWTLP